MANRKQKRKLGFKVESLEQRNLLAADIVINEIHYDPPDKTQRAEFVELYNNTNAAVDLSGWQLDDAVEFTFPAGSSIGSNSYLVIAEDPATVNAVFGVQAIGPWSGALRNSGDRIRLVDAADVIVDEVDYKRGFPWPTVGDEPGHSIELINPNLENDLGGNWRRTGAVADGADPILVQRGDSWKYFPGTETPSTPATAWRQLEFDDGNWSELELPAGYGDGHVQSTLEMRNNYSTVYFRNEFEVADPKQVTGLVFRAQFDDGINVFINGQNVVSDNVSSMNASHTATANSAPENLNFVEYALPSPADYLVAGTNVIAVQLLNASLGGSSDAWFDGELALGQTLVGNNTAGGPNSVLSSNAAPASRQVSHGDAEIRSGDDVVITTKVTDPDGVAAVVLQYQVVEPGDYFGRYLKASSAGTPRLNPRYDDPTEWTTLSMGDGGVGGDATAGDDIYAVTIPGEVQQHRHLVRYRISVSDSLNATVQVPYADDPSPNFVYFVYDAIPDWTAADRPGRTPEVTYDMSEMNSIATYHLLTTAEDHEDSQHIPDAATSVYDGSEYLWPGTLVYDGKVYDNISYRARGGVWRYAMGKNMWKFDFHRNDRFQAKDGYGEEYAEKWDKLNFSALIQQGNFGHRGEQGLFESVGFKLFNLAGVESPNTHYVHFRVVDTVDETTTDQYTGDFQGLYLAIEQPDGRMLEQHGLPDGNFYKIEKYRGTSNNQGPTQVSDGSDVAEFIATSSGSPTAEWWEANLDLDRYYSYRTIVDAIHHYDIAYGKNYFYYHNPETGKFQVHPWDLDLTWADNMYGSGDHAFLNRVFRNRAFRHDADNRARELIDLLYNQEQTGLLIDEMASFVYTAGEPSWVDADRAMWDYNPIMTSGYVNSSKAGAGRFYRQAATDDFPGMAQLMKNYIDQRSSFILRRSTTEDDAPITPTITYNGAEDFSINGLSFETSEFADPNGDTFAAMEWRIAEITDPNNPNFGQPIKYEINATHESGELSTFESQWSPPANVLSPGTLYRARVRMQNQDGNWSHWSEPAEFVSAAAVPTSVADSLRISEIHYHPADPTPAEFDEGFTDQDDFEFVELVNIGSQTISLANTSFQQVDVDGEVQGLSFQFPATRQLAPGERIVIVENLDAFHMRYGLELSLADGMAGQWSGGLGNKSELVRLVDDGTVVQEFRYQDEWHPSTDGDGFSLEVLDPSGDLANWQAAAGWSPSLVVGGTPGTGRSADIQGDLDGSGSVNVTDIDLLFAAIRDQDPASKFDLNQDSQLDQADADFLIEGILQVKRGDFDLSGEVGFADFLMLSAQFGSNDAKWSDGDADGDGSVKFADFLLLSANFGN